MRSLLIMLVSALLGTGPVIAGEAAQVAGQPAKPVDLPKGAASGYPPVGGKGPGTGQGYRQSSPQGGGKKLPAADDSTTGVDTEVTGPVAPQSAGPGPYGYMGRGRPYYGRGYGHGRYQRGYGYGYPGYRGLGGGRYPHHRQFGNPPLYPAQPAANPPSTDAE